METGRIGAVVLAGGRGTRMQSDIQKQYMALGGRPLIVYALETFDSSIVDQVVLVTGAGETKYAREEIVDRYGIRKISAVVEGGAQRYHSVYAGLCALEGCDCVLIHDGARPLVTEAIIRRVVEEARNCGACVVGMPVKDTIKVSGRDGFAAGTPDRSSLWQIQTPQAFSYPLVRQAYDWIMEDESRQAGITDDAMVVEHCTGHPIKLIEGSYENMKVTTPEDLVIAEALLARRRCDRGLQ